MTIRGPPLRTTVGALAAAAALVCFSGLVLSNGVSISEASFGLRLSVSTINVTKSFLFVGSVSGSSSELGN